MCLLWWKSNNQGTHGVLDLAELYSEVTAKKEKTNKQMTCPCLPRYGEHVIEITSGLQGVGLNMVSVARCNISALKETSTLAHGL